MNKLILAAALLFLSCVPSYAESAVSDAAAEHFREAAALQNSGDFEKALDIYRKTVLMDPENAQWPKFCDNNIGVMYMQQGMLSDAADSFNNAIKKDPGYITAKINLGLVYNIQQGKEKAAQYWKTLLGDMSDDLRPKTPIVEQGEPDKSDMFPGLKKEWY